LIGSKLSKRSIFGAKREEKEGRAQKRFKSEKLEDVGHFIIQKPKQKCCKWC